MKKLTVLLVCGSGASSGFMAANMRKAAALRGIEVSLTARTESEIENYVDSIDALMVGPHLKYLMNETADLVGARPVKVILMESSYYSTLNGDQALSHLLSFFE